MLTLKPTTKFKKDYKRMKKQGKDMNSVWLMNFFKTSNSPK